MLSLLALLASTASIITSHRVLLLFISFFFSSRRRHTRYWRDWSSDVCSSDLLMGLMLSPAPGVSASLCTCSLHQPASPLFVDQLPLLTHVPTSLSLSLHRPQLS